MKILKSLQKLGLNINEQSVYFALLQLEKATANQIAYKSKIKRPTTYDILYRLRDEGFVAETVENGKRYFVADNPKKILDRLDEQKSSFKGDLPYLLSIYNTNDKKPRVSYFEGEEGIKRLAEDTLDSLKQGDEILAYVTKETLDFMPRYAKDYVKRRKAKGIKIRGLYNSSIEVAKHLKRDTSELRESRVIDEKMFPLENEINIYANKIIMITYKPEPFGILIESNEAAKTQRTIFELAWRGAK